MASMRARWFFFSCDGGSGGRWGDELAVGRRQRSVTHSCFFLMCGVKFQKVQNDRLVLLNPHPVDAALPLNNSHNANCLCLQSHAAPSCRSEGVLVHPGVEVEEGSTPRLIPEGSTEMHAFSMGDSSATSLEKCAPSFPALWTRGKLERGRQARVLVFSPPRRIRRDPASNNPPSLQKQKGNSTMSTSFCPNLKEPSF